MKRIFYMPAVSQAMADAKVQAGCGYAERAQAETRLAEIKASVDRLSVYRCEVHPRVESLTLRGGGKVRKVSGGKVRNVIRVFNVLRANGKETLEQIGALKAGEFMRFKNAGRKSLEDLREALDAIGVSHNLGTSVVKECLTTGGER